MLTSTVGHFWCMETVLAGFLPDATNNSYGWSRTRTEVRWKLAPYAVVITMIQHRFDARSTSSTTACQRLLIAQWRIPLDAITWLIYLIRSAAGRAHRYAYFLDVSRRMDVVPSNRNRIEERETDRQTDRQTDRESVSQWVNRIILLYCSAMPILFTESRRKLYTTYKPVNVWSDDALAIVDTILCLRVCNTDRT